ncbi:DNA-binding protein [Novosphingobium fuchskuhlense]|uniref:DNA-binding protein n=1 Tax=Novosphingobium fuchskuhlense TaxID=1117702 RepID=UPI000B29080F|nr:DNA-binding protein [Novosphingobium fuchskuhlense]
MQFLTLPKLAAQTGWSVCRIRRLVANQELPHIRVNGRLMLPSNAIDVFVANHFVEPASPRADQGDHIQHSTA